MSKTAPSKEHLIELMLELRFLKNPDWTAIGAKLKVDKRVIRKWVDKYNLTDENKNGPVVDGELIKVAIRERPINYNLTSKEHLEKRLLNKREIDAVTGCWIYIGNWNTNGYGTIRIGRPYDKEFLTHSVAAHIWLEQPLPCKKLIFHKCKTRVCFNPDHFILCNNRKQLMKLRVEHGMTLKGEKNARAKITLSTALDVRDSLLYGEKPIDISRRLKVSHATVCQISKRKSWKWIWKYKG